MTKSVRSRLESLEKKLDTPKRKPVLLLKTFDGGETYGGPEGQTFTDADMVRLNRDYDVLVLTYVDDWRGPETWTDEEDET